jgi:hypothetical protein
MAFFLGTMTHQGYVSLLGPFLQHAECELLPIALDCSVRSIE